MLLEVKTVAWIMVVWHNGMSSCRSLTLLVSFRLPGVALTKSLFTVLSTLSVRVQRLFAAIAIHRLGKRILEQGVLFELIHQTTVDCIGS
jgi:hypothetical protein